MMRNTKSLLAYEAKKKPHIAALVERLATMDESEINALPVIKWIRLALLSEKKEILELSNIANILANSDDYFVFGFSNNPRGKIFRWTGPSTFLNIDRGNSLELRENKLIWYPDSGGIWYETLYSSVVDHRIEHNSIFIRSASKLDYTKQYKEEHSNLHSLVNISEPIEQSIFDTNNLGIRLQRHNIVQPKQY